MVKIAASDDAGGIAHEQHLQRRPGAQRNGAVAHLVEHRQDGVVEGRKQQRIVEDGAVDLPRRGEEDDDHGFADEAVVPQQLRHRRACARPRPERPRQVGGIAQQDSCLAHRALP